MVAITRIVQGNVCTWTMWLLWRRLLVVLSSLELTTAEASGKKMSCLLDPWRTMSCIWRWLTAPTSQTERTPRASAPVAFLGVPTRERCWLHFDSQWWNSSYRRLPSSTRSLPAGGNILAIVLIYLGKRVLCLPVAASSWSLDESARW